MFRINRRIQDNVVLSERDLFEGVQDLMHVVVRLKVHQQHRKSDISSGSAPGNRSELGGENDSLTHHPFEQIYRLEELEPLVVPLLLVLVEHHPEVDLIDVPEPPAPDGSDRSCTVALVQDGHLSEDL